MVMTEIDTIDAPISDFAMGMGIGIPLGATVVTAFAVALLFTS